MATYFIKEETLTSIANEARELLGTTAEIQGSAISTQLNIANNEVAVQETALNLLLEKINNLPESGGSSSSSLQIASGTVMSNENGEIVLPKTSFEPKQMMVWNVQEIELDDYTGHDGVMLCAVKMGSGQWVAHYMASSSGTYYIVQASAERGPFQNIPGYSPTNIEDRADSIVWALGTDSSEDGVNDFTDVILNYVLIG